MILVYIAKVLSLITPLKQGSHVRFINNLLSKTVVLVETELMYRRSPTEMFMPIPDYDQSTTTLDIYSSQDDTWRDIESSGSLAAEHERNGSKNSFFYTANDDKYYLYEFGSNMLGKGEYAIKTNIYEGRQKDPRIISQTDNQIRELSKHMEQGIEYTKLISDVQKLDALAAAEYKIVTSSISSIVLWAILLKLLVFYCMFYYFNRKLRDFYVSKKIVRD